jgi:hypothetical protein
MVALIRFSLKLEAFFVSAFCAADSLIYTPIRI